MANHSGATDLTRPRWASAVDMIYPAAGFYRSRAGRRHPGLSNLRHRLVPFPLPGGLFKLLMLANLSRGGGEPMD